MLNLSKFNTESPNTNTLLSNNLPAKTSNYSVIENNPTKPFVLVLGIDKDTRFLFKTACEIWKYDVAEAADCEQCFSISEFKAPDLVLLDSGIDFAESLEMMQLLQESPLFEDCGFVFISGHAQENVRQTALSAGANFFLVKPIDFGLLESFLQNYFGSKNLAVPHSR